MENTIKASIFLNEKKLYIRFDDTKMTIELPLSGGQYKIVLDGINKNFIGHDIDAPSDDELGLLSGLRYMIPMDQMSEVYSAKDKRNRIIMIQVDAIKNSLYIFKLSLENKVESFEILIDDLKKIKTKIDFGQIEIQERGKLVDFGGVKVSSIDLINWYKR